MGVHSKPLTAYIGGDGYFPATKHWTNFERVYRLFLPARAFYDLRGIRHFVRELNSFVTDERKDNVHGFNALLQFEALATAVAVSDNVGNCSRTNPEWVEWDRERAANPVAEEAEADGARTKKRRDEPPKTIEVPSFTFEDQKTGRERPKVEIFIELLVRKKYDDVVKLYGVENTAGFGITFIINDPAYYLESAITSLIIKTQMRAVKAAESESSNNKYADVGDVGAQRNMHVRGISYGFDDDDRIRGYNVITSDAMWRRHVVAPYVGTDTYVVDKPFSVDAFSEERYLAKCFEAGVCEEQLVSLRVGEGENQYLRVPLPECAFIVTMQDIHPNVIGRTMWPWSSKQHEAFRDPLAVFSASGEGEHGQLPRVSELRAIGVISSTIKRMRRYQYKNVQETQEMHEVYEGLVNDVEMRRSAVYRAVEDILKKARAEIGDEAFNAAVNSVPEALALTLGPNELILEQLRRLADVASCVRLDFVENLRHATAQLELKRLRIQEVLLERFSHTVGIKDKDALPRAVNAVYEWASQFDWIMDCGVPIFSCKISMFANYISQLAVTIQTAFCLSGNTNTVISMIIMAMGAMIDDESMGVNGFIHGRHSTGKSKLLDVLVELLIRGTYMRNSGGGSQKSMIFMDGNENMLEVADEAPHAFTSKRNTKDRGEHSEKVMYLEAMTRGGVTYQMTTQRVHPVTRETRYETVAHNVRCAAARIMASNEVPQDEPMRSRFVLYTVTAPKAGGIMPIDMKMITNGHQISMLAQHITHEMNWVQVLCTVAFKMMHARVIPWPSMLAFNIQLRRTSTLLFERSVPSAMEIRRFSIAQRMYVIARVIKAVYTCFLSELREVGGVTVDTNGKVVFEPYRITPSLFLKLPCHMLDDEEVALKVISDFFNDSVNEQRYMVYKAVFALVAGGSMTFDRLAAWVQATHYHKKLRLGDSFTDEDSRMVHEVYSRADPRAVYILGPFCIGKDGAPKDEPLVAFLTEPTVDPLSVPDACPFLENSHEARVWKARRELQLLEAQASSQTRNRGAPTAARQATINTIPSFPTVQGTDMTWQALKPAMKNIVAQIPGPLLSASNSVANADGTTRRAASNMIHVLEEVEDNQCWSNPNYIQLNCTGLDDLAQSVSRILSLTSTEWTGSDDNIRNIIFDMKTRMTVRAPQIPRRNGGSAMTVEALAECLLPENLPKEVVDMPALRVVSIPGSKQVRVYVALALITLDYASLRWEVFDNLNHRYTRERVVCLGPQYTAEPAPVELRHVRPVDRIIRIRNPSYYDDVTKKVLAHRLDQILDRSKCDGVTDFLTDNDACRMGAAEKELVITGPLEVQCSAEYRWLHNIDCSYLPEEMDKRVVAFYRQYQHHPRIAELLKFDYAAELSQNIMREVSANTSHLMEQLENIETSSDNL